MIVIRTEQELAHALASPPDPELARLLQERLEWLACYPDQTLSDLALLLIVQAGDRLAEVAAACPVSVMGVGGGEAAFSVPAELGRRHARWLELTFILSDDGFGLVLLVAKVPGTERLLLAACEDALRDLERHALS